MEAVKKLLEDSLKDALKKLNINYTDGALVTYSKIPELADYQSNIAFSLAKQTHDNPKVLAQKIVDNLDSEILDKFNVSVVAPAFINFTFLNKGVTDALCGLTKNPFFGIETTLGNGKTVVLDYGGANIAKELHMGHLRSPIIGESIKRLHKLFGYNTISDVHLGDWGLQMGLVIAMLEECNMTDYYYGKSSQKPTITLDFLNENYPKASKKSKVDPEFKQKAETITLKLQSKTEPYYTIWKDIRAVSIEAIKKNYAELNCTFDLWLGESDAYPYITRAVNTFISKGLTEESDGATVVNVAKEGEHIPIPKKNPDDPTEKQLYKNPMPPVIIKKYNGGDLYATTDIATIMQRVEDYKDLTQIIYIVDKRQATHFEGVFRCCRLAGICPDAVTLTHIGYGTMNGKDGKPFKTRSGESIKLQDIIDLVKSKAQEKLIANGVNDNNEDLALKIGISAMKFGDLSNDVSRDYVFDLDSFMSFEGKTGPYLLYTAVRINSVLQKAGNFSECVSFVTPAIKNITLNILKLTEAYSLALTNLSPSLICNALYNLASAYSTFYNDTKIISEPDPEKRNTYLTISKLVYQKLVQGLKILAIDFPDKM